MADKKTIQTTSWELEGRHDDAGADLPLDRVDCLQGQAGPSPCQTGLNLSAKCRSDKKSDSQTDKEKVTHQLAMIPGHTWEVTGQ